VWLFLVLAHAALLLEVLDFPPLLSGLSWKVRGMLPVGPPDACMTELVEIHGKLRKVATTFEHPYHPSRPGSAGRCVLF
jgi:hypothetical protein